MFINYSLDKKCKDSFDQYNETILIFMALFKLPLATSILKPSNEFLDALLDYLKSFSEKFCSFVTKR